MDVSNCACNNQRFSFHHECSKNIQFGNILFFSPHTWQRNKGSCTKPQWTWTTQHTRLWLPLTQLMKKAWINLITSNVTRRLMGIRLLNRMMKVRKLRPKLAAPPSTRRRVSGKRRATQESCQHCLTLSWSADIKFNKRDQSYSQLAPDIVPIREAALEQRCALAGINRFFHPTSSSSNTVAPI